MDKEKQSTNSASVAEKEVLAALEEVLATTTKSGKVEPSQAQLQWIQLVAK